MKAIILISILFVSCQKTYTCDCSIYDKTTGTSRDSNMDGTTKATSKADAQTKCDSMEEESTSYIITCIAK